MVEAELREQICEYGRRLYARGLVCANEGNLSARLGPNEVLCTPTMLCKGYMSPADLAIVDMTGQQLSGPRPRTTEILLHMAIYRERPDVRAVCHTHAPHVVAFAITGTPIPTGIHPELDFFVGPVPTAPYVLPGSAAFAEAVAPLAKSATAIVLANHGIVTFGPDLESAWHATEIVESYCKVLLTAMPLGEPRRLTESQLAELLALKRKCGLPDPRY